MCQTHFWFPANDHPHNESPRDSSVRDQCTIARSVQNSGAVVIQFKSDRTRWHCDSSRYRSHGHSANIPNYYSSNNSGAATSSLSDTTRRQGFCVLIRKVCTCACHFALKSLTTNSLGGSESESDRLIVRCHLRAWAHELDRASVGPGFCHG